MIHIWQRIMDGVFLPSSSLLILRQYSGVPYTNYYAPQIIGDTMTLSSYQSPLIKASITAGKFEHNIKALKDLGEILHAHLMSHQDKYPANTTLLVPIPLHPQRMKERGYNQVEIILKAAARNTEYRIANLLTRIKNTSPQSHLKRAERLSHLNDAFAFAERTINWDSVTTVLLIDDVVTTGSTLEAARAVLALHIPKPVTLQTLAIAH
jgi:ComF family protein